jgi:hypothetical protein
MDVVDAFPLFMTLMALANGGRGHLRSRLKSSRIYQAKKEEKFMARHSLNERERWVDGWMDGGLRERKLCLQVMSY